MDQQTAVNFFTIILGFASLGFLLDQLTVSKRKEELRVTRPASLQTVLRIYFESIYVRFFGERLLSKKFLATSSLIFIALSISLTLLLVHLNGFSLIIFLHGNLVIIAVTFFGSIALFIIILFQTQIFVKGAIQSESGAGRIVFIFSDLLLSSNIFIFLYSFVISVAVFIAWPFYAAPVTASPDRKIIAEYSRVATSEQYSFDINISPEYQGARSTLISPMGFIIESTRESVPVSPLLKPYADVNNKVRVLHGNKQAFVEWSELDLYVHEEMLESSSGKTEIEISADLKNLSQPPFRHLYSNTFLQVDKVEDLFLAILSAEPLYVYTLSAAGLTGDFFPFDRNQYCMLGGYLASIPPRDTSAGIECLSETTIISGTAINSLHVSAVGALKKIAAVLLLSPVYLAMLVPSLLFYSIVLSSFFFRALRFAFASSSLGKMIYETVPFSTFFLFLGIVFWFVFLV